MESKEAIKRAEELYNYKLYSFKQTKEFMHYAWQLADKISKEYGGNRLLNWIDMLWCNVRYGVMHTVDYELFEFYRKSSLERDKFLTRRRYFAFIKSFDKETFYSLMEKSTIYKSYSEFIKRDWLLVDNSTEEGRIKDFIKLHNRAIVKPISSESGKGVYVLDADDVSSVDFLVEDKSRHTYLIEEICENCNELKKINPSSLNTLRIDTIVRPNQNVEIFSVHLRCGRGDTVVDNWGSGGIGYPVDIETGLICGPGIDLNGNKYIVHPGTGQVVIGMKIPRYEEACQLAVDIISKNKKVVYAGLDLAILPDRIELIELNFPPAHLFLQAVDMIGRYDNVKNIYKPTK